MPGELLLDTHALLWWRADSPRLSSRASAAIEAADQLAVSAISLWEVATLVRLGRVELDRAVNTWAADITAGDVRCIDIGPGIAATAGSYPDGHGDPADRLILASAAAERVALVTKDRRLRAMAQSAGVRTIW